MGERGGWASGDGVVRVMLVCTGNIARSPLAAVMLDDLLRSRLGPDASVRVDSCGVHARPGEPAVEGSRAEAADRGLDLSGHRSRAADPRELAACDLVLTMTAAHRRRLAAAWPDGAERTFTLRGFVALAGDSVVAGDPPPPVAGAGGLRARVRAVVRHLAEVRSGRRAGGERHAGDIEDPYFKARPAYRELGDELAALLEVVAEVLTGPR